VIDGAAARNECTCREREHLEGEITKLRALVRLMDDTGERVMAERDAARADAERLAAFVLWLSTYKKNPPEIVKDDFAYDRLLLFVHDECKSALAAYSERVKP
jgi:hypothetical protein